MAAPAQQLSLQTRGCAFPQEIRSSAPRWNCGWLRIRQCSAAEPDSCQVKPQLDHSSCYHPAAWSYSFRPHTVWCRKFLLESNKHFRQRPSGRNLQVASARTPLASERMYSEHLHILQNFGEADSIQQVAVHFLRTVGHTEPDFEVGTNDTTNQKTRASEHSLAPGTGKVGYWDLQCSKVIARSLCFLNDLRAINCRGCSRHDGIPKIVYFLDADRYPSRWNRSTHGLNLDICAILIPRRAVMLVTVMVVLIPGS